MMFYEFNAGGHTYRLHISTRNVVSLEKSLGCNPLGIFGDGDQMPKVGDMITVLFYALQKFHHGIKMDDAYDIYDAFLADGNTMSDFIPVIMEIYKASGIIKPDEVEDAEKN